VVSKLTVLAFNTELSLLPSAGQENSTSEVRWCCVCCWRQV